MPLVGVITHQDYRKRPFGDNTDRKQKKIELSLKNKTCPYESHNFPFQNDPF